MTPRERIARLEGLLARVSKNAQRPRTHRVDAAPARAAPTLMAASPPVATAVAPPKPAPVFEAPSPPPPPVAPPPPPHVAPPARVEAAPPTISTVPPWKAEPASTVQARPSSIPPEELSEDDLVEVTTLPPEAPAPPTVASSSMPADDIEEPPASSSRSKVAESLDQAIASAAAQGDEHEVPIHTPPPESGPQEAVLPAGIEAPRAPEFGDIATELVRPPSLGPTPEQLGETIELEGPEGPEIEIEVAGLPSPEPVRERPVEELEVTLPRAEMPSGTYDSAAEAAPIVASAAPAMPAQAGQAPEITVRPEFGTSEVARVIRVSEKAPEDFKELLDASLAL